MVLVVVMVVASRRCCCCCPLSWFSAREACRWFGGRVDPTLCWSSAFRWLRGEGSQCSTAWPQGDSVPGWLQTLRASQSPTLRLSSGPAWEDHGPGSGETLLQAQGVGVSPVAETSGTKPHRCP